MTMIGAVERTSHDFVARLDRRDHSVLRCRSTSSAFQSSPHRSDTIPGSDNAGILPPLSETGIPYWYAGSASETSTAAAATRHGSVAITVRWLRKPSASQRIAIQGESPDATSSTAAVRAWVPA